MSRQYFADLIDTFLLGRFLYPSKTDIEEFLKEKVNPRLAKIGVRQTTYDTLVKHVSAAVLLSPNFSSVSSATMDVKNFISSLQNSLDFGVCKV
jgi:hypothetical protein